MKIININVKRLLQYLQLNLEQQKMAEDCLKNEVFETTESDDKVENEKTVLLKGQVEYLRTLLWTCAPDEARKLIIEKLTAEKMSTLEDIAGTVDQYISRIHFNRTVHQSIDNGEAFVTSMVEQTTDAAKKFFADIKNNFPFTFHKYQK